MFILYTHKMDSSANNVDMKVDPMNNADTMNKPNTMGGNRNKNRSEKNRSEKNRSEKNRSEKNRSEKNKNKNSQRGGEVVPHSTEKGLAFSELKGGKRNKNRSEKNNRKNKRSEKNKSQKNKNRKNKH